METRLKRTRLARGLTQQKLGEQVDLSRCYVSALERGTRKGPAAVWDRLEMALGVDQRLLRQADENAD